MNKQLEEAIKRLEHIDRYYDCNNYYSRHDLDCIETVLKKLKRLQEENLKMKTEISEHTYWESTPLAEIKNLYIAKDKIREKIEEIKLPLVIVGGRRNSKTLNYGKKLGKIEILQELLEGK